jgi:hypothetical protein
MSRNRITMMVDGQTKRRSGSGSSNLTQLPHQQAESTVAKAKKPSQ